MINDKEEGEVLESSDYNKHLSLNKIYEEDTSTKYMLNYFTNRQSILYEKLEQVGEGTFGKVFKARYKLSGRYKEDPFFKIDYVALKKILMDNEKEGFPITAIREVMILKRLSHKNIISLLEIVTSKPNEKNKNRGNIFLVFEYMEHDLNGLLERKISFDIPQIKCILFQIMNGLLYLHNNSIIHRDIKGANILLNNKGEVKIADFGLARNYHKNSNIFYTNKVVTLWYRSPELLLGAQKYDFNIDIWSVGCLFAELLTGNVLFKGTKEADQIEKIFEKCGTPTEEYWPEASSLKLFNQLCPKTIYPRKLREFLLVDSGNLRLEESALDLIEKMLEMNPKKRITAKQVLEHKYFSEIPLMSSAKDLPKFDKDSHEYLHKMNRLKQTNQVKDMVITSKPYINQNYYNKNNLINNLNYENFKQELKNENFLKQKRSEKKKI